MTQERSSSHPVEALSAYLDREIEAPGRVEIEAHLESCPGCRALLEDLRRLDAAVGAEVAPPVPAGLARRIRSRLGPADAGAAAVPKPPRPRRSGWFGPLPLAAAASLVVVGALWLLSPERSTAPSSPPPPAADERTMARNDAEKDFAPAPPPAANGPAARPSAAGEAKSSPSSQQEPTPLEQEARPRTQPGVAAPKIAAPRVQPEPRAQAPAGDRDRPAMRQVEAGNAAAPSSRLETGVTTAAAPGASAAAPGASAGAPGDFRAGSWPVRIEAPPYHVLLTSENEMIVNRGASTCAVAIDPADGRRLVRMARAESALYLSAPATASAAPADAPPSPDGATKSAAKETAPASAAAPRPAPGAEAPGQATAARALSPAGEAALQLIRGRYRAQIEEHCLHVLP